MLEDLMVQCFAKELCMTIAGRDIGRFGNDLMDIRMKRSM